VTPSVDARSADVLPDQPQQMVSVGD
jgi:hypothetical protein